MWDDNVTGPFAHAETLYPIRCGFASIFSNFFQKNSTKLQTKRQAEFVTGEQTFVGLDIHKNNIRADPPYALPGDHEIVFSAKKTE